MLSLPLIDSLPYVRLLPFGAEGETITGMHWTAGWGSLMTVVGTLGGAWLGAWYGHRRSVQESAAATGRFETDQASTLKRFEAEQAATRELFEAQQATTLSLFEAEKAEARHLAYLERKRLVEHEQRNAIAEILEAVNAWDNAMVERLVEKTNTLDAVLAEKDSSDRPAIEQAADKKHGLAQKDFYAACNRAELIINDEAIGQAVYALQVAIVNTAERLVTVISMEPEVYGTEIRAAANATTPFKLSALECSAALKRITKARLPFTAQPG